MDLVALLSACIGFVAASDGHLTVGFIALLFPLVLFAVFHGKILRRHLLLPFSFGSWFVALLLGALIMYVLESPFPLGLAVYYYACVCLFDRKVRFTYGGFGWETATRHDRPVVYWLFVSAFFGLSAVLMVIGLLGAARGLGR